jgi:hypothetical protein
LERVGGGRVRRVRGGEGVGAMGQNAVIIAL